jgi:hypothetical protein
MMKEIAWKLQDFLVAYLVSIGLGILFFSPIVVPLWELLGLTGKGDFVYALASAAALGNPIGLCLTLWWRRKKVRRLWAVLPLTFVFSTAGAAAFLYLGEWVEFHTTLIVNEVPLILACMAGASVVCCIGWHATNWAVRVRKNAVA